MKAYAGVEIVDRKEKIILRKLRYSSSTEHG